ALKGLVPAIDASELSRAGPAGSKVVIVTYSSGTELKLPLTDLSKLAGSALGGQRDYYGRIGDDLVQGITAGLDQLAASDTPRKALIVIGDGNDTNNEAAATQFPELASRAETERVEIYALIYKTQLSSDGSSITKLIRDAKQVQSQAEIADALRDIGKRISAHYAVTFNAKELPWDGIRHRLVIQAGRGEIVTAAVLPVWERPPL